MDGSRIEDWRVVRLDEVLSVLEPGLRPRGGVTTEGDIPSLGGENVTQDGRLDLGEVKKIPLDFFGSMGRGRLELGDVLINKDGAQTGKVAAYRGEFPRAAINEHLFRMRGSEAIDNGFLFWRLLDAETQQKIRAVATGSAQPGINTSFPQAVSFPLPPLLEQRRIAEILDTVDRAIRHTEAIIVKLEQIKAGLLHDLLTRGFDENGELRDPERHPEQFKDSPLGSIPREWQVVALKGLAESGEIELGRGNVISHDDMNATPGTYPVYSSAVGNDGKIGEYGRYMFDEELITWSIDGGGNVFHRPRHRFSVTNISGFLRLHTEAVTYRFLYYSLFLQHQRIQFDYTLKAHPSVIVDLYHVPVAELDEQKRIQEVVIRHDARIKQEQILLLKLRKLKTALMQDLLTGRVRVPTDKPAAATA